MEEQQQLQQLQGEAVPPGPGCTEDQLPVELQVEIFEQLGLLDLVRCERVCRTWRGLLAHSSGYLTDALWRKLHHRHFGTFTTSGSSGDEKEERDHTPSWRAACVHAATVYRSYLSSILDDGNIPWDEQRARAMLELALNEGHEVIVKRIVQHPDFPVGQLLYHFYEDAGSGVLHYALRVANNFEVVRAVLERMEALGWRINPHALEMALRVPDPAFLNRVLKHVYPNWGTDQLTQAELDEALFPIIGSIRSLYLGAADSEKIEVLKYLQERCMQKHEIDEYQRIALANACSVSRHATLDFLLEQMGSEIGDNPSPLVYAVENGQLDIVEKLLAHGADVNAIHSSGCSCLHIACQLRPLHDMTMLETLLSHGALNNPTGSRDALKDLLAEKPWTDQDRLHQAYALRLLRNYPTREDEPRHDATRPDPMELALLCVGWLDEQSLQYASWEADRVEEAVYQMSKLLLSHPHRQATTADLLRIVRLCSSRLLNLILGTTHECSSEDLSGLLASVLSESKLHYRDATVEYLIAMMGADANGMGREGKRPIHEVQIDDTGILDVLLRHGADINATDEAGFTMLHHQILSDGMSITTEWLPALRDRGFDFTVRKDEKSYYDWYLLSVQDSGYVDQETKEMLLTLVHASPP